MLGRKLRKRDKLSKKTLNSFDVDQVKNIYSDNNVGYYAKDFTVFEYTGDVRKLRKVVNQYIPK